MKWQTKVEMFLNNTELLQDIKSILMLLVSIVLPMIYFSYSKNFSLSGLFNWYFGVLALFVILGNVIVFFESSEKALRDEKATNEDVTKVEASTLELQTTLPKRIDSLIAFNKFYNDEQQHNKNIEFTNDVIRKYEIKVLKRKIRGKPHDQLDKEIERLHETPLFNKRYKPVQIQNIVSLEKVKRNEMSGNDAFTVNPKTYGFKRFMAKQPLKAISVGGSGMFMLGFTESLGTIITFYIIYLLSLAILFAMRYVLARKITKTLYVKSLTKKQEYIAEYHEWYKQVDFVIDFSGQLDKEYIPKEKALI